jgi:aspartate racemase
MLALVGRGELTELTDYLLQEVRRLVRAGAETALIASNTPHIVLDDLQLASPIPLISIVETACRKSSSERLNKVGLFGAKFTMQGSFYQRVFEREGIDLLTPEIDDQELIHDGFMTELIRGIYRDETRQNFVAIT